MTHPDDKFRLSDQLRDQENMCLRDEVTRLTKALEEATAVAIMYREQIKKYQQEMMK